MSRPTPDVYQLPDLEIDFSFKKLIFSLIAVCLFLVLPIVLIDGYIHPRPTSNTPQVAGISTTSAQNDTYISIFGEKFDLNSSAGSFALIGLTLIGIAIILILFLIIDSFVRKGSAKHH